MSENNPWLEITKQEEQLRPGLSGETWEMHFPIERFVSVDIPPPTEPYDEEDIATATDIIYLFISKCKEDFIAIVEDWYDFPSGSGENIYLWLEYSNGVTPEDLVEYLYDEGFWEKNS